MFNFVSRLNTLFDLEIESINSGGSSILSWGLNFNGFVRENKFSLVPFAVAVGLLHYMDSDLKILQLLKHQSAWARRAQKIAFESLNL